MKKILMLMLPFAFLFAEETTAPKAVEKEKNGYCYLNLMTSNNFKVQNLLYPYYIGVGYRYKMDNNGIDANVNIPYTTIKDFANLFVSSDISYIRFSETNYYWSIGLTQEIGDTNYLNYYLISPFFAFGKEFKIMNSDAFVHLKLNSLSYFPYIESFDEGFKVCEKDSILELPLFNLCLGFSY